MFEQGTLINLYCHVTGTRASKGDARQQRFRTLMITNPRQRGGKLRILLEYHGQGDLIPIYIPLELLLRILTGLIIGSVFNRLK